MSLSARSLTDGPAKRGRLTAIVGIALLGRAIQFIIIAGTTLLHGGRYAGENCHY